MTTIDNIMALADEYMRWGGKDRDRQALRAAIEAALGSGEINSTTSMSSTSDAALLRQALEAMTNVLAGGDFDNPYADLKAAAAAIKERLK
jgi:hypothetical protein